MINMFTQCPKEQGLVIRVRWEGGRRGAPAGAARSKRPDGHQQGSAHTPSCTAPPPRRCRPGMLCGCCPVPLLAPDCALTSKSLHILPALQRLWCAGWRGGAAQLAPPSAPLRRHCCCYACAVLSIGLLQFIRRRRRRRRHRAPLLLPPTITQRPALEARPTLR